LNSNSSSIVVNSGSAGIGNFDIQLIRRESVPTSLLDTVVINNGENFKLNIVSNMIVVDSDGYVFESVVPTMINENITSIVAQTLMTTGGVLRVVGDSAAFILSQPKYNIDIGVLSIA